MGWRRAPGPQPARTGVTAGRLGSHRPSAGPPYAAPPGTGSLPRDSNHMFWYHMFAISGPTSRHARRRPATLSSERQVAANRKNALKSTGPRTAAGKTSSSRNALKHGLLSAQMVLPDEDPKELAALADAIHECLAPEGEMEQALVDRVVACLWRLRRVHQVEASVYGLEISGLRKDGSLWFRLGHDADGFRIEDIELGLAYRRASETLTKLTRYETTIERGMYQALHELQRLQAERGARETAPAVLDVDVRVGE